MSARVTDSEVEEIIEVDSSIGLTPFIAIATLLVDEELADQGMSAARLKEIERWLSAHFYAVRDPRVTSESAGVSASYEGSAGQNLAFTRYGQQAMVLDTSGILAAMNEGGSANATFKSIRYTQE